MLFDQVEERQCQVAAGGVAHDEYVLGIILFEDVAIRLEAVVGSGGKRVLRPAGTKA
jgi:hypothetical protein